MKLFRYISGNNEEQNKISMTTPVYMNNDSVGSSMDFVMPSKFDLNNIYKPSDNDVKIIESKAGYFASFKYGGYSNSSKVENYTNKLYEILDNKNIEYIGHPSYVSYNSPYNFLVEGMKLLLK